MDEFEQLVDMIHTEVTETYDNFVFETVKPFCSHVMRQTISKETLATALLKQKPISPIETDGKLYCGSCGKRIHIKTKPKFCCKCGQAIGGLL